MVTVPVDTKELCTVHMTSHLETSSVEVYETWSELNQNISSESECLQNLIAFYELLIIEVAGDLSS